MTLLGLVVLILAMLYEGPRLEVRIALGLVGALLALVPHLVTLRR